MAKQYPPAAIERAAQRLHWADYFDQKNRFSTLERFRAKVLANPKKYLAPEDFLEVPFDPTVGAMDYRCYDKFPSVAAAEKFFTQAKEFYGVAGIVVYTPEDPVQNMGHGKHGVGNYPFVLMQEGWQVGSSSQYITELASLAEEHGGVYQYS
jgi:hypothetical protein